MFLINFLDNGDPTTGIPWVPPGNNCLIIASILLSLFVMASLENFCIEFFINLHGNRSQFCWFELSVTLATVCHALSSFVKDFLRLELFAALAETEIWKKVSDTFFRFSNSYRLRKGSQQISLLNSAFCSFEDKSWTKIFKTTRLPFIRKFKLKINPLNFQVDSKNLQ